MGQISINRNILECKYIRSSVFGDNGICINRNILECKLNSQFVADGYTPVLIETYWNVNEANQDADAWKFGVLIETYWNVNA